MDLDPYYSNPGNLVPLLSPYFLGILPVRDGHDHVTQC